MSTSNMGGLWLKSIFAYCTCNARTLIYASDPVYPTKCNACGKNMDDLDKEYQVMHDELVAREAKEKAEYEEPDSDSDDDNGGLTKIPKWTCSNKAVEALFNTCIRITASKDIKPFEDKESSLGSVMDGSLAKKYFEHYQTLDTVGRKSANKIVRDSDGDAANMVAALSTMLCPAM
jgi:hypothetical protein